MEKKKLIIVAVALIAVIIVVAGAAAAFFMSTDSYDAMVAQGYRYLEDGDFNNAIVAFQTAVEMDDSQEDAYIGMYNSYVRFGHYEEALMVARTGLERTNSTLFNSMVLEMESYTNSLNRDDETQDDDDNDSNQDKNVTPSLNRDMLSFFDAAAFGDYNTRYGSATSQTVDGKYELRLNGLPATLVYFDTDSQRVINQSNGLPYNTYLPNEIRMDNVMILFGGVEEMDFITLKNLTGVADAQIHDGTATFRFGKCQITIVCDGEKINSQCSNSIIPSGEYTEESEQNLKLTIQNAATGLALGDATVKAYEGYGTVGTPVEGKTDASGNVTLLLPKSGTYTLQVSKEGFITESFEIYVLAGDTYQTLNVAPAMSDDVIRFVLTWDASPQDLDSYLFGTSSDGTRLRVCYLDKQKNDSNGQKIAELDVDDTNGFGPETITLYDTAGNYEFIVADYMASGTMSYSGAQVKIYVGSSLYTTIDIPSGLENQWHVCQVVNGEITVTNRAANLGSSSGIK